MAFFRRKSKEEDLEELRDIVKSSKFETEIPEEKPKEEIRTEEETMPVQQKPVQEEKQPIPIQEPPKPTFAPLFVKIEKYRNVLDSINDLKITIIMLKNALAVQRQIEGLRDENRKFLELATDKIDKKVVSLDTEFLRPKGLEEDFPPATYETEGLEGVVDDLKKQIEGLKSELKAIT
jgi:predicted nucleic acid-binding protein